MNFLPPDFVITKTLKVGVVYRMTAPELIETSIPHYFLVIAIDGSDNYMIMSTSKYRTKLDYFDKAGISYDTLAEIKPNVSNGLTKDSYFDCNDYEVISKQTLIQKVKDNILTYEGKFSEEEYNTIVEAITKSELFDLPKYLLRYER